jgi:hypothetical protein
MKRITIFGIVIFIIVGLWSAAWIYASGLIRQNLTALADADGQSSPKLTCEQLDIGGFPLYFDVNCTSLAITSGDLNATVGDVKASVLVYDPWHAVAFITGPLIVSDAFTGSRQQLDWKSLQASARLKDWRIGRISLVGQELALADIVGDRVPLGTAGHAELHRIDAPAQYDAAKHLAALQLYATVSDLNAPGPGIAAGKSTFEGVLTGLPDDVRTYGEPDLLQRWQAAGGKLQLVGFKGSDGDATSFEVTGNLALDAAFKPAGQLNLSSKGLVERFGTLVPEQWRGLVLGAPAADGSYHQVLNLTNGMAFAGLLPLGALPAIQ